MPFNLNGIGSIVEKIPVVGRGINKVVNAVGNPIQQIVSIPVNLATSMAKNIASMQQNLSKAASNAAIGLSQFVSSPLFTYAVVGGLVIAGIYVINNGGQAPLPPQISRMLGK